jgi:uncharacterized damage-inducible protein DinB
MTPKTPPTLDPIPQKEGEMARRYAARMDPLKIYDYLVKARERVFDAVRALPPEEYGREFPIGLRTIGSTLTHVMTNEWAHIERIEGRRLPLYETWPIQDEHPPAFAVIEKTWREQAPRIRSALAAVREWDRELEYDARDWATPEMRGGKTVIVTTTVSDLFTQMALHEVHHRAQVMSMLRELGKPLANLDYGYFMYKRREVAVPA